MAYFITASASASVVQTTFDTTGSIVTSSLFTPNDPLNVDNITTIKKSRSQYPSLNRPIYKESVSFTDNNGTAVNWLYDNTASRDSDFNIIKTLNTNYEKSGGGGSIDTGSLLTTASVSSNTITFTKGDGSTFPILVDTGSATSIDTGSFATTGSNVFVGNQVITGSLTLHNVGTSSPTLNFENDGASTPLSQIKGQSYGSGTGGGLDFYYYDGSHKEGFQLNNTGNVGIGTSSPPQRLTVSGSISASGQLTVGTASIAGITYPIADGDNGDIIYTDGAGNLTFDKTKTYAPVKNVAGGTLYKGTPVHASSSVGNTNEVIASSASNAATMPATFVLAQDLADEEEGLGIVTGFINGVNTTGFNEGDVVYVGANGGYTDVKPSGSNLIQNLGIITKVAVNGSGYIYGAGRSNDTPNLLHNNIFYGSGSDQTYQTHLSGALDTTIINNITASGDISASGAIVSGKLLLPSESSSPTGVYEGQIALVNKGGTHYIYVFVGGAWKSSSLA